MERSRLRATTLSCGLLLAGAGAQAQEEPTVLHLGSVPTAAVRGQGLPPRGPQTTVEDGAVCTTIDFEGLGNLSAVPTFDGISSPGWLSLIDADAGGSGNFAFEPSPQTIAFWLGGAPGSRDIVLTEPASKVGFFYASFVTVRLEAFDSAGNSLDVATGPPNFDQGPGGDPTGSFNKWDPIEVETDEIDIARVRVTGNVNQTGIDNLKVCRRLRIHSVEATQAIQQIQEIDDLEADLAGDREPPVPLIADKPAALRVHMDQVQAVTQVQVEVTIPGVLSQTRSLVLQPQCDARLRRRRENGCQSIDFFFTPRSGNWTATVRLLTDTGDEVDRRELPFRSRSADRLVLRSVSVCDARTAGGGWSCAGAGGLGGLVGLLGRTAPTHRVDVSATGSFVRNDIQRYDADGNGTISGAEAGNWFVDTVAMVGDLFSLWDRFLGLFGQERYYYGLLRPAVPGGIGGIADGIPSRGAMSRTSTVRLGVEVNFETLAHETGHMLGRRHTNTQVPAAGAAPPGCYNLAVDPGTDWPFADNTLQSANGPEVGFNVALNRVLLPESNFDWMSYCTPRWISPFTYTRAMSPLGAFAAVAVETTTGPFWTVSGALESGSARLGPIFELVVTGSTAAESGTHRIETRDASEAALHTRSFTPRQAHLETTDVDIEGPPVFFELIPVQAAAASIVVLDPDGIELARVSLAGAAPTVTITSPGPGSTLSGPVEVRWSIDDPDSTTHWTAVDYSTDDGTTWSRLGQVAGEAALTVDFDQVAGASAPLLRVTASDGVRSGSAVLGSFAVERKGPTVEILNPQAGRVFRPLELVLLEANAYDVDDGFLDGGAVAWTSSLDGPLGTGAQLPLTSLSSGTHAVQVKATDSDGGQATASVTIRVAGAPPTLDLTVTPLDQLPTTCVQVDIDARPGSAVVGLRAVEYSLDGGATWAAVPRLPFRFIVPGQGFFHLVARAFDEASQLDAADARFFIDSPCQRQNEPPVADAGPDQVVTCSTAAGTPVTLDGSGSFDPEGAPLTYLWTGPFPEGGGSATGVSPTVTLPLGRSTVTLVVNDGLLDSAPDTADAVVAAGLSGFEPPLAALVPEGQTPPLPPGDFQQGRTLPLKLRLFCGEALLTDQDVAAPRILSLTRDGVPIDLSEVDLDAGGGGGLDFRFSDDHWIYNLSTRDLEPGHHVIGLRLPDGRIVLGAFDLR